MCTSKGRENHIPGRAENTATTKELALLAALPLGKCGAVQTLQQEAEVTLCT